MSTMAYNAIQSAGAIKITKDAVWQCAVKIDRDFASGESVVLKIIDHGKELFTATFSTIGSDGSITISMTTIQIATIPNGWYDFRLFLSSGSTSYLIEGVPNKVYVGD